MNKLYYVKNIGCDATTYGLVRISEEDFPKFKSFIENLNRNSYYDCMPTIAVYEISENEIIEINDGDDVDRGDCLYLDGKVYTYAERAKYDFEFNKKRVI